MKDGGTCYLLLLLNVFFKITKWKNQSALFGLGSRKLRVWKCEDLRRKCEENLVYLDWDILEWMCEESLLKFVSNVMVVRKI